jgi:hypothetical protein
MKSAQHQQQSISGQFRRPTFWVTVIVYLLLTVGVSSFVASPLFRTFVEQNPNGLLNGYYSYHSGYDVVGAIVRHIGNDIFFAQQLVALLVSIVMLVLRKHIGVALGILAVVLTFSVIAFCAMLLSVMTRHDF